MPEKEVPLGFLDKIWINHELIEPGTYDRYEIDDKGGTPYVTFRCLNLRRETYNAGSVYLEHRLRHFPPTDTTAPAEQIQDVLQRPRYRMPRKFPLRDRLHSNFYTNQSTPESPESTLIWTATDLRAAGSTGFYIKIYSFREIFLIEQILYVEKDPRNGRITVCCIMPDATLERATYCLSKITSAGPLAQ